MRSGGFFLLNITLYDRIFIPMLCQFDSSLPGHRIDLWVKIVGEFKLICIGVHFTKICCLLAVQRPGMMACRRLCLRERSHSFGTLFSVFSFEQKQKLGGSVENYFYTKMSLINQCAVKGKCAQECKYVAEIFAFTLQFRRISTQFRLSKIQFKKPVPFVLTVTKGVIPILNQSGSVPFAIKFAMKR